MVATEILARLDSLGFSITDKKGLGGHSRIIHKKINKGSLYVGDQYISATGKYVEIKNNISESTLDHKGYPEWRNGNIKNMLDYLENWINYSNLN